MARLQLIQLTCDHPERATDRVELRVMATDAATTALPQEMSRGEVWRLGQVIQFRDEATVTLMHVDENHSLGELLVPNAPTRTSSAPYVQFNWHACHYTLVYRVLPDNPTQEATVAPGRSACLVAREVHNKLVLVAGTVDPGNTGEEHRAASYSRPGEAGGARYWGQPIPDLAAAGARDGAHWYWEDNPLLRASLERLDRDYRSLDLFPFHGWSGDNSPDNREIAGAYLADRLMEYYHGNRTQEVHFHLLGHSHGGNVINEVCKRAAARSDWPHGWKIRSITYLSTPFFQTLHRVDTTRFHPDCKIINVINDYDLTQRVLADFNLFQLNNILELNEFGAVATATSELLSATTAALTVLQSNWRPAAESIRPSLSAGAIVVNRTFAEPMYRALQTVATKLETLVTRGRAVVDGLYRGIEYPVALELVGRVSQGRRVISAGLRDRFHRFIDRIRTAVHATQRLLTLRIDSRVYPISEVLEDFSPTGLLAVVADAIQIVGVDGEPGAGALSGPLIDLMRDFLLEQIDVFDDTRRSPDHQLAGTPFADDIYTVNVTRHDAFHIRPRFSARFAGFVARIEAIEQRYHRTRQSVHIVDMVLLMLAQAELVREGVRSASEPLNQVRELLAEVSAYNLGPLATQLTRLVGAADTWVTLLHERDVGGLEVIPHVRARHASARTDPVVGSLPYLMRVSHSQSRFELYPEVAALLTAQFTTCLRT